MVGCIAGALQEGDYRTKLGAAGFEQIEIEPWRVNDMSDGKFASAFIRAQKAESPACCGPACCQ